MEYFKGCWNLAMIIYINLEYFKIEKALEQKETITCQV
jgi:hypothetical protein